MHYGTQMTQTKAQMTADLFIRKESYYCEANKNSRKSAL